MNTTNLSNEQKILNAAEQEFLTKGFDGARTTTIAKAAGVTHAMLHYYFRTKESLFQRIVDDKFSTISHLMFTIIQDSSLPLLERIKGGIEAHFDYVAQNPNLPRFVINEVISHPERYELFQKRIGETVGNVYQNLQKDIDQAAKQGDIIYIDVKMLFISIMSLNIFTFIAYPFMEPLMGDLMTDRQKFLNERKAENVETILKRLKI